MFQWDLRCLFAKLIDDPEELEWFVTTVVTEAWHHQHDAGRPLAEMLPERIAEYPEHALLIEAYAARFNESIPGPVPGSLELVEALHQRGVPLYAITNFGAELWPPFRADQPVFDLFRDIVVSGVEKVAKPEPGIFEIAAARFGHPPAGMLFIDDKAENIAVAASLGWQTHLFDGAGRLKVELKQRLLIE